MRIVLTQKAKNMLFEQTAERNHQMRRKSAKSPSPGILASLAGCFLSLLLSGASAQEPAVRTVVSIPPQKEIVERVGGDRVSVEVLLPPGRSPATYEPSPKQMAALTDADFFLRIGVPFENVLMKRISELAPDLRIVDMREGLQLRSMEGHSHEEEDEQAHEEHAHEEHTHGGHSHEEGSDPHFWLDPGKVANQVRIVYEALVEEDPEGKEVYGKNRAALVSDLFLLHMSIDKQLAPHRGKTMLVFHPAWGYFADAFGLKQKAIEAGGKEPGAKHLTRLIQEARRENVQAIFIQPQFSKKTAESIADSIGAKIVVIDPLAENYLENLKQVAGKIDKALSDQEDKEGKP